MRWIRALNFQQRAAVMWSVPKFLVGMFTLEEIVRRSHSGTRMEVVLDASQDALAPTSRWGSDLQGEVVPTFPATRGGSLDSID